MGRIVLHDREIKSKRNNFPDSYHPDLLEITTVKDLALKADDLPGIPSSTTVADLKQWFSGQGMDSSFNTLLITDNNSFIGTTNRSKIIEKNSEKNLPLSSVMAKKVYSVYEDNSLQLAVEFML